MGLKERPGNVAHASTDTYIILTKTSQMERELFIFQVKFRKISQFTIVP